MGMVKYNLGVITIKQLYQKTIGFFRIQLNDKHNDDKLILLIYYDSTSYKNLAKVK